MNHHHSKLQQQPFNRISSGEKTIEVRLYDEKRKTFAVGDHITFTAPGGETCTKQIGGLQTYATFEAMLDAHPISRFGPTTREAVLKNIKTYYNAEQVATYGVLAIHVE